ncbi:MAG: hypothetical protein RL385_5272 [Pseudomonadota bacterium]|jgi:hypothetical protein
MLETRSFLRSSRDLVALLLLLFAAPASLASADCLAPPPRVLWTYPANSDLDVPVDTSLWLAANVSSFSIVPRVELNGAPVSVEPSNPSTMVPLRFNPPKLESNTSYRWTLHYPPSEGQPATTFEVQFKTGQTQRRAAPKVRVVAHAEYDIASSAHPCSAILASQRCLDTIGDLPPRRHELKVAPSSAVGWLVRSAKGERTLWPAVCGAPQIVIDESQAKECFAVQAIGPGGQLGPQRDYCTSEKLAPLRLATSAPRPVGLSPLTPLPSPPAPVPTAPTPAAPPSRETKAEPAAKPDSRSQGGCSVGGKDAPVGPGIVLTLAGMWLRRRRAKREDPKPPFSPGGVGPK